MKISIRLVLSFVIVWLLGCSSQPDKRQLFTLHSPSVSTLSQSLNFEGGLGIGPIVLPESLGVSEVVTYGEGNKVIADLDYAWAGDLKLAISRVIAATVGKQTGSEDVWSYPWDARTKPKSQISIHVESLGGRLGDTVNLNAKWRLLAEGGKKVVQSGVCRFDASTRNASYGAYVEAVNLIVNRCADVLVGQLVASE